MYWRELKIGDKVGKLTLLRLDNLRQDGRLRWRFWCKCECGEELYRWETSFVRGAQSSCSGCHPTRHNKGEGSSVWKGRGELNGQYWCAIKTSAKNRNIDFNLDIDYAWNLFLKQGSLCALTGLPISIVAHKAKREGVIQTASLDRIDSDKPYEEGNVQWLHKDVNRMKQVFSQERFLEICRLVTEHQDRLRTVDLASSRDESVPDAPHSGLFSASHVDQANLP